MKTFSDGTYSKSDAESNWLASNNEAGIDPGADYDGYWTEHPDFAWMEYVLAKHMSPGAQVTEWENWCTANAKDPEPGFLHVSSVRHIGAHGFYPMKLDYLPYKQFVAEKCIGLIKRTWWAVKETWMNEPGLLLWDLVHWYPSLDSGTDNVQITDEYPLGTYPLDYDHPRAINCVDIFMYAQAALNTEFGAGVKLLIPNYGSLWFTSFTDVRTLAILTAVEGQWLMCQVAMEHNNLDNWLDNGAIDYIIATAGALIDTGGRNIKTMGGMWDQASSPFPSNKGKRIATCAQYLFHNDNWYGQYRSAVNATDPGAHLDVYEYNAMMRSGYLGDAKDAYTTDGRLYQREFANGTVYLWTKEDKDDPSELKEITVPPGAYELKEDGTLSLLSSPVSLQSNDGLIAITGDTQDSKTYTTGSPLEEWPIAVPDQAHWLNIKDGVLTADDSTLITTQGKGLDENLYFPIPAHTKSICEFTFGLRFRGTFGEILPGVELRLQNDNGEVFAVNEIGAFEATLINKQWSFRGLDLTTGDFQNNRVVVNVRSRDFAALDNGKTFVAYAI